MNPPSFMRVLTGCACLAVTASLAKAQIYDFKGYIDTSNSPFFQVGETVDFQETLVSPLINDGPSVGYPSNAYWYRAASSSLLIGGIQRVKPTVPGLWGFPALGTYTNDLSTGTGWGGYFDHDLSSFGVTIVSADASPIVGPTGLLIGGVPIEPIYSIGSFSDSANEYGTIKYTEYSVVPAASNAVPEPETYGAFGAGALCLLVIMKRRRTAT